MAVHIYTDLAMEARELHPELHGVSEENAEKSGISISRIEIQTDEAAQMLSKERGSYITIDAPDLVSRPLDLFERVSQTLCEELAQLVTGLPETATVLVVGLGNRSVTPDSLGPRVVEQVYVTRHVNQYLPEVLSSPVRSVCAVSPGVLGITGIETQEIVRGIVQHVKPDLIVMIDALASRRAARISTTVQLSSAGISPGSGVGNTRAGMNQTTLGVPVIAIGVPLVVYASTISQDTIGLIASQTGLHGDEQHLKDLAKRWRPSIWMRWLSRPRTSTAS